MLPDPAFSGSSVTSQLTTQTSDDIITSENFKQVLEPSSHGGFNEISNSKTSSLEAEITISLLRKTKTQLLSLSEVDPQSKRLLDTLVEMVIEMLIQMQPEEKDIIEELISAKARVVFVCVLLFVLVMAIRNLLFNSAPRNSFGKPPPPT
ncbi:uncharacterized protein LOC133802264 [Humulus lupulus]|uniref:uncharacterized protein LOC133802264 n=1 Tax=Humulus lupulus TaxID=3486 RepID=UPI002B4058F6|nr:uncharacterized protein LOC133802264 [Humulus lupulus]